MKQIPLATKSLRHKASQSKQVHYFNLSVRQLTDKDADRRFRFIGKVKKINKISLVKLSPSADG